MLSRDRRLRTRDIDRLFARSTTQKIIAYPFVYFVDKKKTSLKMQQTVNGSHLKRGVQVSNKISKSSVKRHILKRVFYDCVDATGNSFVEGFEHGYTYCVLAVPQKTRQESIIQLLATSEKTTIVSHLKKEYTTSLSLLRKKILGQVGSKKH